MPPTIDVREEVEGDGVRATNFLFRRIGEPVPVIPTEGGGDCKAYDPNDLPSQPLVVSDQLQLVFVAHSSGFRVERIGDVRRKAERFQNERERSSVLAWCVVDVPVGKVHLLSLSLDSTTLAACVGGTVYFFSVDSLKNKELNPFFCCSIDEGSSVKDMRWLKKVWENPYILLTSEGNLYLGSTDAPLECIMDNVDAVDCGADGKFFAVARNNSLKIIRKSQLLEELDIALPLQPGTGESSDFSVKVDSLKWIRPDCIILGCFQLTSDGREESYLLQVIRTRDGKMFNAFSEAILQPFYDVFPGIKNDIIPAGCGPHLFFNYLEQSIGNLAIAANKKNVEQHIIMFFWPPGESMNRAELLDIDREIYLPRIELQENEDDNSILGLYIYKEEPSYGRYLHVGKRIYRKFCVLFCLSLEGKLIIFDVFRTAVDWPYPPLE